MPVILDIPFIELARGLWPIALPALLGAAAIALLLPRPRGVPGLTGAVMAGAALLAALWFLIRGGGANPETVLFYSFAGIAITAGGLLVTQRNPARAALSFALVVLATCGLFLLQAAPFLAAATIIVYAGAIVVTFLFAPYFVNGFMADPAHGSALWAYATGIAELIAAALAPVLGAIADAGQRRKPWIGVFSAMLVVGLCGLWLAAPGRTDLTLLVLIAFGIATIGAELATVFTNAMMTSLVSERRLGTLSGAGWAAGYVGGLVSLALVAGLLVADPATGKTLLGLPPLVPLDPATREGDRLVGPVSALWYLVFVLPLFLYTPDRRTEPCAARAVTAVLAEFMSSVKDLVRNHGEVALFLLARMIYADGLGAVFAFGGIYAATIFGWGATELGLFGIILTLAGAIGVPANRIHAIVKGTRDITADTDLRLSRYFGLSEGYFLRLQNAHDMLEAKRRAGAALAKIKPRSHVGRRRSAA